LTVAVRTKHPKILDAVIVGNPVDVIDLNGKRLPPPLRDAAPRATIF
jgi:hypothetical protein